MLIISIIRQTLTTMALLFPRRTLITLIVHVMSGIVRSSPWSHPPLTALHNCDTKRVESIFRSWVVLFLPFSFVRHLFRSIKAAHTSEEICLISWVSRLSSAGIHVPIISSMRIIVLRNLGGIQSEQNFSDSIQ